MMALLGLKISPKNAKGETVQPAKGQKATVTVSGLDCPAGNGRCNCRHAEGVPRDL